MDKFIERELKILITKEQFEELLNSYDFNKPIIQVNTYYDTNDRKIKNNKGALRIRKIDDKNIFTLKIRKDEITHLEYEKEINTDDLQDIKDPQILEWLDRFDIPLQLSPITTFKTKRYTLDFESGQLCADITSYENHTDYELEYEYKENHDGIAFFNSILKPFKIQYKKNCPSKIARAFNDQNLWVNR